MANRLREGGPALTTREAAKLLSVHGNTVRRLIHRGEIVSFKVGNDYRVLPQDLQRFITEARQ